MINYCFLIMIIIIIIIIIIMLIHIYNNNNNKTYQALNKEGQHFNHKGNVEYEMRFNVNEHGFNSHLQPRRDQPTHKAGDHPRIVQHFGGIPQEELSQSQRYQHPKGDGPPHQHQIIVVVILILIILIIVLIAVIVIVIVIVIIILSGVIATPLLTSLVLILVAIVVVIVIVIFILLSIAFSNCSSMEGFLDNTRGYGRYKGKLQLSDSIILWAHVSNN